MTGEGTLRSLEISYARHSKEYSPFTLTCRSEGGPVTNVEWRRNGEIVQEDSNHTTNQIVVNTSQNAVYENTLTVRRREEGKYHCKVSNNIPEYFCNLTYLSHNTSMTIEGAYSSLCHLTLRIKIK